MNVFFLSCWGAYSIRKLQPIGFFLPIQAWWGSPAPVVRGELWGVAGAPLFPFPRTGPELPKALLPLLGTEGCDMGVLDPGKEPTRVCQSEQREPPALLRVGKHVGRFEPSLPFPSQAPAALPVPCLHDPTSNQLHASCFVSLPGNYTRKQQPEPLMPTFRSIWNPATSDQPWHVRPWVGRGASRGGQGLAGAATLPSRCVTSGLPAAIPSRLVQWCPWYMPSFGSSQGSLLHLHLLANHRTKLKAQKVLTVPHTHSVPHTHIWLLWTVLVRSDRFLTPFFHEARTLFPFLPRDFPSFPPSICQTRRKSLPSLAEVPA